MKSTILGLAFITAAFVAPSTGWGESPPAATGPAPAVAPATAAAPPKELCKAKNDGARVAVPATSKPLDKSVDKSVINPDAAK